MLKLLKRYPCMENRHVYKMTVFVTVGSTKFDELIKAVCSSNILNLFQKQGYEKLLIQSGNGDIEPSLPNEDYKIKLESYKYKNSIAEDIKQASLVISHAGAGSILENLKAGKKLIVVINDCLLNNHQTELATAMADLGYLLYCTPNKLEDVLIKIEDHETKNYPTPDYDAFPSFLNRLMGFN
ncbi:Alg13 [Cordylochernes scorpioides]|uniref:UDP-N-acetylglucosamine transferase subunit ALG13 n=1 Tax=Cordylochernes scorpioides TaxID=51811 RepID=A0ABY6K9Q3_9ARAC|nr:Alg13 [Cordylochernes scorpioides]